MRVRGNSQESNRLEIRTPCIFQPVRFPQLGHGDDKRKGLDWCLGSKENRLEPNGSLSPENLSKSRPMFGFQPRIKVYQYPAVRPSQGR
jgi:hypothetical protein